MSDDEIPRRFRVDKYSPGELAIRAALHAVEAMGADVRLTDAVVLLGRAKDRVADFVDGVEIVPVVPMTAPEIAQVFLDMAKALNNIGAEFAGPSSHPQHAKDIEQLRAVFERHNITSPRMREALKAIGVEW